MPSKIRHLEFAETTGEPIRKAGSPQVMELLVLDARRRIVAYIGELKAGEQNGWA